MKIRASAGTAMRLDLTKGKADVPPTTAYLMIPGDKCRGGCIFCPQAKGESGWLSRVSWPLFEMDELISKIADSDLQRICLQCPDVDGYEEKLRESVKELERAGKPISVSVPPISDGTLEELEKTVDRIGVGIDAATDELRGKTKPNYEPKIFWDFLGKSVDVFDEGNVTVHIIAGLGESLPELGLAVNRAVNVGADVSLFPYQPDDKEEKAPDIGYYRRAQLMTYLITDGKSVSEALNRLAEEPKSVLNEADPGELFKTQGCPGCNRPYYTTRPGEEHRNYPREPGKKEIEKIKKDLERGD